MSGAGDERVADDLASLAVSPALYKKLNYDPVKDFAPITKFATVPNMLVARAGFVDASEPRQHHAQLVPGVPHAQHMHGHVLRRMGRIDEAVSAFEAAERLEAGYTWINSAQIHAMLRLIPLPLPSP